MEHFQVRWKFINVQVLSHASFITLQYAQALSTIDGYSGYGAEQGNKVRFLL